MQGIPTWITNDNVTLMKTKNGYAITASPQSSVNESVAFETASALTYYLNLYYFPNATAPST